MEKAFPANPGKFFYENLMIGGQMMDLGRQASRSLLPEGNLINGNNRHKGKPDRCLWNPRKRH